MAKTRVARFKTAEHLEDEEAIAEYLAGAARDPDPEAFVMAIGNVARAKGMAQVAKESGLGRESLYKALARGAKPRYETVRRLVETLGLHLTVKTGRRTTRYHSAR